MFTHVMGLLRGKLPAIAAGLAVGVASQSLLAASWTWSGALGTTVWNTDGQWTTPGAPVVEDASGPTPRGEDLIFGASPVSTTIELRNANVEDAALSMTFNAGAPQYTFQRTGFPTLDIDIWGAGGLTQNSSVAQLVKAGLAFDSNDGPQTVSLNAGDAGSNYSLDKLDHVWINGNGGVTINGPFDIHVTGTGNTAMQGSMNLTLNNTKIVVEGGTTLRDTYTINGNGSIILKGAWNPSNSNAVVNKAGTGTLDLAGGNNNPVRPMTVSGGILRLGNNLSLGNSATGGTGSGNRSLTVSGGGATSTVQLYNNITLNKFVNISGRSGTGAPVVAMLNDSGNNTLSGTVNLSTGGTYYNFGSKNAGEKLTVAGGLAAASNAGGTRILTFRGAGDGEFSGNGFGANNATANMPVFQYGSGTLTLNSPDTYRLGHLIAWNGGTIKLGATFANGEVDPNYPLFAAADDFTSPNPIRIQLLNNSKIDVSQAVNLRVPSTTFVGLNRTLAGTGTIIGDIMTVPADSANTANRYRNSDPNGKAAFKPGNGVNLDPADPNGIDLLNNGTATFSGGIGKLTVQGNLDMLSGASSDDLQWHLGAFKDQSTGVAGMDWDLLSVTGDVKLDNNDTLTLGSFTLGSASGPDAVTPDAFWSSSHSWKVLDAGTNSSGTNNLVFAPGTITHYDGLGDFSLSLGAGGDAGDVFVNWTAVPEPSTIALGVIGAMGFFARRRRSRA